MVELAQILSQIGFTPIGGDNQIFRRLPIGGLLECPSLPLHLRRNSSPIGSPSRRPIVELLQPNLLLDSRRLDKRLLVPKVINESLLTRDVIEERKHRVKIPLLDRIELMVVA